MTDPQPAQLQKEVLMAQAVDRFLFGLCFGMGFAVAGAVLAFIVTLLQHGAH